MKLQKSNNKDFHLTILGLPNCVYGPVFLFNGILIFLLFVGIPCSKRQESRIDRAAKGSK